MEMTEKELEAFRERKRKFLKTIEAEHAAAMAILQNQHCNKPLK